MDLRLASEGEIVLRVIFQLRRSHFGDENLSVCLDSEGTFTVRKKERRLITYRSGVLGDVAKKIT